MDREIVDEGSGRIVSDVVSELERAWNAGDGARFARPFADDADFVNIRGEHFRTRAVIANGHQGIFDTIYKDSVVRFHLTDVRAIAPDVLVAHVKSTLKAPTGPLAGEHNSLFTVVLVQDHDDWRITAFHNTLVA
jgi:uncharacterized protein (TIGR02246 family)